VVDLAAPEVVLFLLSFAALFLRVDSYRVW